VFFKKAGGSIASIYVVLAGNANIWHLLCKCFKYLR